MNILVTGGAGFMGSHFLKLLMSKPFETISCVDKLTYAGNRDNIDGLIERDLSFYQMDIIDSRIGRILEDEQIDTIVNFAAETHVDRSICDPKAFLETDVMGLFNLVSCSMKAGVKRFIHISTDEVYGPISETKMVPDDYLDEDCYGGMHLVPSEKEIVNEATETYPLNPTSPYSASKASADLLLQAYYKTYGFPVIIVRPCNNYGPNQYPEKLIPMAITRLLQKKKILLHGEGKEVREWIYVEDCVKAIERIMLDGKIGEIYNVGSGLKRPNERIIRRVILFALFPKGYCMAHDEEDVLFDEWTERLLNRPGNDLRYAINNEKIHKELFYGDVSYLQTEFEEGLEKMVDWYRNNPNFWKEVDLQANIYQEGEYLR